LTHHTHTLTPLPRAPTRNLGDEKPASRGQEKDGGESIWNKRMKGRRRNQIKTRPTCRVCFCVCLFVCLVGRSCLERARALSPNPFRAQTPPLHTDGRTDGRTHARTHTKHHALHALCVCVVCKREPQTKHSPVSLTQPSSSRGKVGDKGQRAGLFVCVVVLGVFPFGAGAIFLCLRVCVRVFLPPRFVFVCLFVLFCFVSSEIAIRAVIMTHQHGVFA
jgi:hypothetical protein